MFKIIKNIDIRDSFPLKKRKLLAFVHIEKAAGTTLIHLLRRNFFMRYCDVKPLTKTSNGIFTAKDMKKFLMFNPFITSIAGHAVKPYSDLSNLFLEVRYITLLRNPITRYLSQYQYWVEHLGYKESFNEFLKLRSEFNFQTKKIAGCEDILKAKKILCEKFFLVGCVEQFDEFLILLKKKLSPFYFSPFYKRKNVGNKKSAIKKVFKENMDKFEHEVIKRNSMDIELYNYVKDILLPRQISTYGLNFQKDLDTFKLANNSYQNNNVLQYFDYLVRKVYYEPIFGYFRKRKGLKPRGSY